MDNLSQTFDISRFKVTCANCSLAELCLPWGLKKEDLSALEKIVKQIRPLQKGEYLFHEGEKFENIYAVRSGAIKTYHTNEDGVAQILGFYLPGELLGLDAIERMEHVCTTEALETSSFCAIPFTTLEDVCNKIPGLQHQMYRLMSRELTTENESLLLLSKKSAEEKIATFLVSISTRLKVLGYSSTEFRLPMSRQEIANYLALTVETVSRIFSRIQKEKLIEIDRKLIKIVNPTGLHGMCQASAHKDE
jgi:CRP/FNR family transcriptional regulator